MVPFIHSTALAFAEIARALAKTGERAHAGYLVLTNITKLLQQARPDSAATFSSTWSLLGPSSKSNDGLGLPPAQTLWLGVDCYPARGASCLSAEYAWRKLMPDFAALLRSLCMALEAWPQEVPKPQIFGEPDDHRHSPLGLQYKVHPLLSDAPHAQQLLPSQSVSPASVPGQCAEAEISCRGQYAVGPGVLTCAFVAAHSPLCGPVHPHGQATCGKGRAARIHCGSVRGREQRPPLLGTGEGAQQW